MNRRREDYAKSNLKYKTVLCTNWEKKGSCPYGKKCQYAHGKSDISFVQNNKQKFEMCCSPCFCDECIWCPPFKRWKSPTPFQLVNP